jgi:hypothetical protein
MTSDVNIAFPATTAAIRGVDLSRLDEPIAASNSFKVNPRAPLPLTTGLAAGETAPPIYPGNP